MPLMGLINKWDSQTTYAKTAFLYVVLEEKIYINMPEGISEVLEEHYTYGNILTLIECIYCLV